MAPTRVSPRSFYLNEEHELLRGVRDSRGSDPKYAPIDWADKGARLHRSLANTRAQLDVLGDPIKLNHYFLLATPQKVMKKISINKKLAPDGFHDDPVELGGKDSRVFARLGLDMLSVTSEGSAIVHVTPERAKQLELTANKLDEFGTREKNRWAMLDSFSLIPSSLRIDEKWLEALTQNDLADAIIELQPLLGRLEVNEVIRAIAAKVQMNAPRGQLLKGGGTDLSGRQWLRASLSKNVLHDLSESFISVQALHPPLISQVSGSFAFGGVTASLPSVNSAGLPVVAVVDTGIPADHLALKGIVRGRYSSPTSGGGHGDHGSFVASRIVCGDVAGPEPDR